MTFQILHWNFTNSSGYWFTPQNIENIDFCTFFTGTSQQWSLLKWNCDFWVSWNISDQLHRIHCPKLLYFFRKCTKSSKIRLRGAVPPFNWGAWPTNVNLELIAVVKFDTSDVQTFAWTWTSGAWSNFFKKKFFTLVSKDLRVVEWVALIRFLGGMWHYQSTLDFAFLF